VEEGEGIMYILTHPTVLPSARALAEQLRGRIMDRVIVTCNPGKVHGRLVRWGNSSPTLVQSNLNKAEAISVVANKNLFSQAMDKLDFPHVIIQRGTPERFPVVIRKVLTGCGGVGIVLCHNLRDFEANHRNNYWSYWHYFGPELGVHVFQGKILKIFKKVRSDGMPEEEFPIRNLTRGYSFVRVNEVNFPKLIPYMEEFYRRFPIAFGRLDVGWDKEKKLYTAIEMNSAPGIASNTDTLLAYANAFSEVL
jgi:hypothetical protein